MPVLITAYCELLVVGLEEMRCMTGKTNWLIILFPGIRCLTSKYVREMPCRRHCSACPLSYLKALNADFFQRMHTENFLAGVNAMCCLEAFQAE